MKLQEKSMQNVGVKDELDIRLIKNMKLVTKVMVDFSFLWKDRIEQYIESESCDPETELDRQAVKEFYEGIHRCKEAYRYLSSKRIVAEGKLHWNKKGQVITNMGKLKPTEHMEACVFDPNSGKYRWINLSNASLKDIVNSVANLEDIVVRKIHIESKEEFETKLYHNMLHINKKETDAYIALLMQENELTMIKLQELGNIYNYQSIYKWMHGLTLPDQENMERLANVFKVPIIFLYQFDGL